MVYFILLLPRLNENDSKLLATPEIVEARETLLQKLLNKKNAVMKASENSEVVNTFPDGGIIYSTQEDECPSQQKDVLAEVVNALQETEIDDHGNTEQWLEDEDVETCTSVDARKLPASEDDVSFSDLEDDDNDFSGKLSSFRPAQSNKASSPGEWVQLGDAQGGLQKAGQSSSQEKDSEGEESNDWLTIDNVDSDSYATV
ncbi:unnamed protein product [Ilex paraguariensis]|uniref:Uncharacterized protein n=1 Tax=Ilex paraguariensis TaxID=185542 RepID=A0ABC8U3G2_9AQUA